MPSSTTSNAGVAPSPAAVRRGPVTVEGARRGATRRVPADRRFEGEVAPPPSKSVTNRYLNLALLAARPVVLERPLAAEDTERFLAALERLGTAVRRGGEEIALEPGPLPAGAEIDCGASGTMARFLTATLATLEGDWRLDGVPRLRQRPLAPLVEALRRLGAEIDYLGAPGGLPLAIRGGRLAGGSVTLDAGESSQYVSALLMAATRAAAPVAVEAERLVSVPYLELTVAAMAAFGVGVERRGERRLRVESARPAGGRFRVEADFSAACYPAAAAALTGGRVRLAGLAPDSRQGDRRFFDLLAAMGAAVSWRGDALEVAGGAGLAAVDVALADLPDQVPTLAAVAPFARGVTRIRGVAHLRLKESDRLAAVARGLRAAGAEVEEREAGLAIPGVWADREPPAEPVVLDPCDDHRLAMSFAVLGLRRRGVEIAQPEVVGKSYPGFWRDFEACLAA